MRAVHRAAFAGPDSAPGQPPVEVGPVDALRADGAWIPDLSQAAEGDGGEAAGDAVCARGRVGTAPALGLGPLAVLPARQRQSVGSALMHAVRGAADALGEPLAVLLGHTGYDPRFGFRPAAEYGIVPPGPAWAEHFRARALTAYDPALRGPFICAVPFNGL